MHLFSNECIIISYFKEKTTTKVPHDDFPWRGKIWLIGLPNDQEKQHLDQVPPNIRDRYKPYIAFINTQWVGKCFSNFVISHWSTLVHKYIHK